MADTFIPLPIETVKEADEQPSLTYRLDLDNGRIVGRVDGLDAVNQAIRKAILTPRFKCLIYNSAYGSEIEDAIISKDASSEYIASVTEGFVIDALRPDSRILSVSDFHFDFCEDKAYISFRVDTIFGSIEFEEVI